MPRFARRILVSTVVGLACVLAFHTQTPTAKADFGVALPVPVALPLPAGPIVYPAYGLGSYCSAYNTNGVWGVYWGLDNLWVQCNRVQQNLSFGGARVAGWYRGYYRLNGYNRVTLQCGYLRRYIVGYGDIPLQQAYHYAQFYNTGYCLFSVN